MLFPSFILPLLAIFATTASSTKITFSASLQALPKNSRQDVIIELEPVLGQVLQNPSIQSLSGDAKRNEIIKLLKQRTSLSQKPVIAALDSVGMGNQIRSFWIANRLSVRDADISILQTLSKVPGLSFVVREPHQAKIFPVTESVSADEEEDSTTTSDTPASGRASQVQWGVEKIKAPEVWASGYTGEGVVAGVIDTGANVNHVALKDNYRGGEGSWLDAFGEHPDAPYDGNGHGTHCTGTICGRSDGIGVAPGAKWISCRGLNDEGSGNETTLLTCGEFMGCPAGDPDAGSCSGFPNLVSNSWGGLIGGMDWYNEVINTWRSLEIMPIFALGNSGPLCMTAGSPGDQDNLISVGATDNKDGLAAFSSRGPALLTGKTKPEVSAPGKDVVSAAHNSNTGLKKLSGTSMACPHVSGATALMLSKNPNLDFDTILKTLEDTAVKVPIGFASSASVCTFPAKYPNNGFGHGRIDALAAVTAI